MTNGEKEQPLNILLSRDELMLVLGELDSDYIPGLDVDPLGELAPEQQSLALTVAGRGLMARELAGLTDEGDLVLHTALLTAVGVCAYSQNALFAYHWPAGSDAPTRYFGHLRGDVSVVHTRPQDVLHLFSLLPSRAALIDEVVALSGSSTSPTKSNFSGELTVSGADFGRARELAAAGDADQAAVVLGGAALPGAVALADTLAASPDVTILQTLKQLESGDIQKRDFTLIASQNGHGAWLVTAGADDEAPLMAKPAGAEDLRALLIEAT
ncbi:MAG: hypothetical protein KDI03_03490 [Anaerolineae bacterium]|nr:hypothetical protein [Anaerolineae bacterium]MCB0205182.1 hypothetical protein [Anaerolineae bacterium]